MIRPEEFERVRNLASAAVDTVQAEKWGMMDDTSRALALDTAVNNIYMAIDLLANMCKRLQREMGR